MPGGNDMEIWKRNLFVCWFGVFATSTGLSQLAPILPLYIDQLGLHDMAAIERMSGVAYGVTFITMAIFAPIWGQAADRYGRKPMLLRASMGMALVVASMGFVDSVWQLVGLRLLQGTISGYYSASITLVAIQTPAARSGWALGTLSTAAVAGMLLGPMIGGYLAEVLGIRSIFFAIGGLLVIAFLLSALFVREDFTPCAAAVRLSAREMWRLLPDGRLIAAMFVTTMMLQLALMSIQPIITVYILHMAAHTSYIALISGLVFSASGLASVLAAPQLGRLADRIGPHKVFFGALICAGVLFIPQAFARDAWELAGLRFLLGIATAGLLPSINSLLRKATPEAFTGRIYGYNQSAQFVGAFAGSVMGGQIAAFFDIRYVFFVTGALLLVNALWVYGTVYGRVDSRQGRRAQVCDPGESPGGPDAE